jgi:hypothetical protein
MTATRIELDIHDMVRELTEPHSNRETYVHEDAATGTVWEGMAHVTEQPSLVDQLLAGTTATGSQAGTVPGSRPALSVESFDLVMMIDDEAGRWVERLGENAPVDRLDGLLPVRGSGTKARIRRVHALYPATESCKKPHGRRTGRRDSSRSWCCERHRIEADVKRWWQQARIVAGFDSSAVFRPRNTCPVCEVKKGLRVNVETSVGLCTECWTVFAGDDWQDLVMHIRIENTPDPDEAKEPTA